MGRQGGIISQVVSILPILHIICKISELYIAKTASNRGGQLDCPGCVKIALDSDVWFC